jgi:anti-sigma factor RsiW
MNCKQARNLFDAHFDGELSPALAAELDAHRLHCASCRQGMALMEVAGHVIASSDSRTTVSDDFTDRLLACIAKEPPRRQYRFWVMRVGAPLAAAALLVFSFTLWNRPEPRVLDHRVESGNGQLVDPIRQERGSVPLPEAANVDEAADAFQQTVSEAMQRTRQTSQSLVRFGNMTLLQVIDALQLEQLRNGEPPDADPPLQGNTTPDDADDIEEI